VERAEVGTGLDRLAAGRDAGRVGCNRGSGPGRHCESIDVLRLEPPLETLADPLDREQPAVAPAPHGRLADAESLRRLQGAQPAFAHISQRDILNDSSYSRVDNSDGDEGLVGGRP